MFADDLNAFRLFAANTSQTQIEHCMKACQASVHEWGQVNRVLFDPSKEHFATIHHIQGSGDDFKLLGVKIDVKLSMLSAVLNIVGKAVP